MKLSERAVAAALADANIVHVAQGTGSFKATILALANYVITKLAPIAVSGSGADLAAQSVSTAKIADAAITPAQTKTKTAVALADAAATLTAAQIVNSGIFTITPTVARILTTDTAANIVAALPRYQVGTWFDISIVNNAAFDVTLSPGTGVTLSGKTIVNDASGTWRARIDSATAITIYNIAVSKGGGGGGPTIPWTATLDDAANNTASAPIIIEHTTTGVPAVGIGAKLPFKVETTAGSVTAGEIEFVSTDVATGSEDFDIVFRSMTAGVLTEKFRMNALGQMIAKQNGSASVPIYTFDAVKTLSGFYRTDGGVGISDGAVLQQKWAYGTTYIAGPSFVGSSEMADNAPTYGGFRRSLWNYTASETLVPYSVTGGVITNTGAAGAITITLPAAVAGRDYEFAVTAAQNIIIDAAGTDTLRIGTSVSTAGGTATNGTIGSVIRFVCVKAGEYFAMAGSQGTWTLA